jgi:hypothetical protein
MHATRWLAILGGFLIAAVIVELLTIVRAPMGYQDDAGFHAGAPHPDRETLQLD